MKDTLTNDELFAIAKALSMGPWPGYPERSDRLFSTSPGLTVKNGVLFVPNGPWHIQKHANRNGVSAKYVDAEIPSDQMSASTADRERWRHMGLSLDMLGRPLHPYWRQLLDDERIGLPTGIGMFYRYGPNISVDAIIYKTVRDNAQPRYLLIKQRATGKWGLPGGFIDAKDKDEKAAITREVKEETGLLVGDYLAEQIMRNMPLRRRDTLHAWSETVVFMFHVEPAYLADTPAIAGDDAEDIGWFSEAQMQELDMQDTHPSYIAQGRAFIR